MTNASIEAADGVLDSRVPSLKQDIFSRGFAKVCLPILSLMLAVVLDILMPRSYEQKVVEEPWFSFLLLAVLGVYLFMLAYKKMRSSATAAAPFIAGAVLFFNIYNVLSAKLAVLPVLYFPAPDRILAVFTEDPVYLMTCVAYSYRLLLLGWLFGALVGVLTGVLVGFSKTASYWISPLVRGLGPIPSTAWIPLVLVAFPSVVSGSVFLIALAVWFPTTVLTASGIANIKKSYFEAASTLGASRFYQIIHVGIPAAMPNVFLGLFNGTCSSFITLMTAEMLGAKYGLGWYINWQKEMMAYSNVYAGLIMIAVSFYLIITGMFKIRSRVLGWQEGVIKW